MTPGLRKMEPERKVPCGDDDRAAAVGGDVVDGFLDGLGVEGFAVGDGAEVGDGGIARGGGGGARGGMTGAKGGEGEGECGWFEVGHDGARFHG